MTLIPLEVIGNSSIW